MQWGAQMDVWPRQPLNKPKGEVWESESDPDTLGGTQGCKHLTQGKTAPLRDNPLYSMYKL